MKRALTIALIILCGTAFVAGLVQLFLLRFEAGDVYPPYSSLRADPLGTMALFESLEQLPGVTVRRDYSEANRLPEEKHTTYLHVGAGDYEWRELPVELFNEMESFATRGGRLAVAFAPVTSSNFFFRPPPTMTTTNTAGTNAPGARPARGKKVVGEDDPPLPTASLEERWRIGLAYEALEQGDADAYLPAAATNVSGLTLPESLEWHSGLVFTNLDASWRVIYARGQNPVVVERRFGQGTVVLASDSFFLSNEALWRDRQPELLAWFVGAPALAVFDEAHLGVVESSGIAVLMRRYRLHGAVGALLLLAGLFIWKNSFSLVPPAAEEIRRDHIAGKDAAAGFVNLLRRNIPPAQLLDVCFDEWTKTLTRASRHTLARVDRASEIMERQRHSDPVKTYQQIAEALQHSRTAAPQSTPGEAATQPGTRNVKPGTPL